MLNFGLSDLRLVAPRDGWPNPDAVPTAAGADEVLERARVYENVSDAVADCVHVYATTVRRREIARPVLDAEQAARAIRASVERSAILFGPERSGLESDDIAIARTILAIPINPDFGSLNLAQAVALVAYEWSKSSVLAQPPAITPEPPAPQADLDGLITRIDAALDATGYFFPPEKAPATRRLLRAILTKPGWSAREIKTLRGVVEALARPRGG